MCAGASVDTIQIGVLIQRMIQPIVAGVAFTANPLSGVDTELVINSSWGVGEALVSGQVDPDEFVIRKRDGELLWSRVGDKGSKGRSTVLSLLPNQIRELTRILMAIERHYRAAQDVEWCHDGAEFWVVQSRPITTARPGGLETEWTRANLAEVLPDVTSPQALSAFEHLLNRAEAQSLGRLMAPQEALGPMLKSFCGRLYFNLSQLRHVCAISGVAPAVMLKSMGHADTIEPHDEKPAPAPLSERIACVPDLLRTLVRHLRVETLLRTHDMKVQEYLAYLAARNPRHLSDAEIWSVLDDWFRRSPDFMQAVLLLAGVMFHETPVRKACEKSGFSFERLVYPQLAVGERSVSAQQAFDLSALAETAHHEAVVMQYLLNGASDLSRAREVFRGTAFAAGFERFLQDYGHRGRYESDWSLPRYNEDPTPLLRAIRAHLEKDSHRSSSEVALRQKKESAEAWAAFTARLSRWQRWTILPRVRRSIQRIKQYYVWRERVRSDMVHVLGSVRTWHLVLAHRFVERGWLDSQDEYFLIHLDEIASVIKGERKPETLRTLTRERRLEMERNRSLQMPLLMRESELSRLIRTSGVSSRTADETQLSGQPVSGGCVEAEVVVVRDPSDFARMKQGAILVAPATDPSWTPLLTLASGVVVEVGGVLSHASTIAREYGLPALANVKHATKRLRTGERIRLDAIRGVISRLHNSTASDAQDGSEFYPADAFGLARIRATVPNSDFH
jgi:phosphohistidine swiveling domain-containing protein